MSRRAAFLDRDGTIIDDTGYLADPDHVHLCPRAADAIRCLNEHDVATVVITNQSGIARGLLTRADYDAVARRLSELLAAEGARVDATYVCPHHPSITGPCDCRKPGTKLFADAIADLALDAPASMFVGDRLRDVIPAQTFGGRAYLVRARSTPAGDLAEAARFGAEIVDSLWGAVARYLADDDEPR